MVLIVFLCISSFVKLPQKSIIDDAAKWQGWNQFFLDKWDFGHLFVGVVGDDIFLSRNLLFKNIFQIIFGNVPKIIHFAALVGLVCSSLRRKSTSSWHLLANFPFLYWPFGKSLFVFFRFEESTGHPRVWTCHGFVFVSHYSVSTNTGTNEVQNVVDPSKTKNTPLFYRQNVRNPNLTLCPTVALCFCCYISFLKNNIKRILFQNVFLAKIFFCWPVPPLLWPPFGISNTPKDQIGGGGSYEVSTQKLAEKFGPYMVGESQQWVGWKPIKKSTPFASRFFLMIVRQ